MDCECLLRLPAAVKLRSTGVNGGAPSGVSEKNKRNPMKFRYYLIKEPGHYIWSIIQWPEDFYLLLNHNDDVYFSFWLGHVMWLLNSIFSLKDFEVLNDNNISVDMLTKTKQFLWSFFFHLHGKIRSEIRITGEFHCAINGAQGT